MAATILKLPTDNSLPVVGGRPVQARLPNKELRAREYVTEAEVERICAAAKKRGRYGLRDACMITMAYRHGLRVSELVGMVWAQLDLDGGRFHVRRLKGSHDGVHALEGDVIRALRAIRRDQPADARHVWLSERGAAISDKGFARMLSRAAAAAGLADLRVHPHSLRHGTGFALANDGTNPLAIQQHLGHARIENTMVYVRLAPGVSATKRWRRTV